MEEIVTAAEAVFTEGMAIPEDKEELEEEQEMWTAQWEHRLVMILFLYCSILLIVHFRHLLTWRGSVHFLNNAYLLVHSSSTFSLVSLSLDILIS